MNRKFSWAFILYHVNLVFCQRQLFQVKEERMKISCPDESVNLSSGDQLYEDFLDIMGPPLQNFPRSVFFFLPHIDMSITYISVNK